MELWIRSQDRKKLIKVDEVKIETVKEGNTFIYSHATDLGTYETKERAIEVLNEIQDRIINIQIFMKDEKALKNNYPLYPYMECVYQMPKE